MLSGAVAPITLERVLIDSLCSRPCCVRGQVRRSLTSAFAVVPAQFQFEARLRARLEAARDDGTRTAVMQEWQLKRVLDRLFQAKMKSGFKRWRAFVKLEK